MTVWIDALYNPQAITSVFGNVVPSLVGIDLHEVLLNRDLPHATVRFDLNDFPAAPPRKWTPADNVVQLELGLDLVRRVSIVGWDAGCRADLSLHRKGDGVVLASRNSACSLEIEADIARIMGMSAYRR